MKLTDELKAAISAETQHRLDAFARLRGYDSITAAASYVSDPIFGDEAQRAVDVRGRTWHALGKIFAAVEAGSHPPLTGFGDVEELLSDLADGWLGCPTPAS